MHIKVNVSSVVADEPYYACAFDDPWEWELVDVGAMCESHSLFIEDEYTSMWRPEYDHDGDEIRSYNCDEIQKKIDTLSVVEIR